MHHFLLRGLLRRLAVRLQERESVLVLGDVDLLEVAVFGLLIQHAHSPHETLRLVIVEDSPIVGLGDVHADPRRRHAVGARRQVVHAEALRFTRLFVPRIVGPVEELQRADRAAREQLLADHLVELPDLDVDVRLQDALAHPDGDGLREVDHLAETLLGHGGDDGRVGLGLEGHVEVAAPVVGQIAHDDVAQLHGGRGETQELSNHSDEVLVAEWRRATDVCRQTPCPVAVARPAAVEDAVPHAVQGRAVHAVVEAHDGQDSVPTRVDEP
mmetsp:Transcript_24012/g.71459  ORF Transcript_24012/g.71459 Transcript_24012/m.71459 type:complete len:270 (-) Transcript_24012:207-1016(-)